MKDSEKAAKRALAAEWDAFMTTGEPPKDAFLVNLAKDYVVRAKEIERLRKDVVDVSSLITAGGVPSSLAPLGDWDGGVATTGDWAGPPNAIRPVRHSLARSEGTKFQFHLMRNFMYQI